MNQRQRPSEHSILICLLALFLINSPLKQWWSTLALPWYAIYVAWLLIIVLVALNQQRQNRNSDRGD